MHASCDVFKTFIHRYIGRNILGSKIYPTHYFVDALSVFGDHYLTVQHYFWDALVEGWRRAVAI